MLKPMSRNPFLGHALAHNWAFCDIVINSINISISMVNDIVFEFPDKSITAKSV